MVDIVEAVVLESNQGQNVAGVNGSDPVGTNGKVKVVLADNEIYDHELTVGSPRYYAMIRAASAAARRFADSDGLMYWEKGPDLLKERTRPKKKESQN